MRSLLFVRPFTIEVPEPVLVDLRERLTRARFAEPTPGRPWAAGTDPDFLRELVGHWLSGYAWRAAERELNALPQFLYTVDGVTVHCVHTRGSGALPLVLTHGWPSSFLEMLPLIPLLGNDFDLVIPSLPGYAFSAPLPGPTTLATIAELWHGLLTSLGYPRYGLYGGDIGAGVSTWLAALHPESVVGLYTHHPTYPPARAREELSPAEEEFTAFLRAKAAGDSAYAHLQETRPDTLAAALVDSPVGLAAWLVEKFQRWGDCHGDVESRFSKDLLITNTMLYWVTNNIGTSFRPYRDEPGAPALPPVTVPTGITLGVEDFTMPREFAARVYPDIRQWRAHGTGGHFFALEEPGLLAQDLRDFFDPLWTS